jgi:hypothetical protein
VDTQNPGDGAFGNVLVEERLDFRLAPGQFDLSRPAPHRPPQNNALRSAPCQRFFRALAYEVALDFGGERKGKGED